MPKDSSLATVQYQSYQDLGNGTTAAGMSRVDLQAGEDLFGDVQKVEQRGNYYLIQTAGTFVIKPGSGFIYSIHVLGGALGAVTAYDNNAGSGTQIIPGVTPTQGQVLASNIAFNTGTDHHDSIRDYHPYFLPLMANIIEQRSREGKCFIVGSNQQALTIAGNFRLTLQNPVGSNRTIYIYKLSANSDINAVAYANLIKSPATGLPVGVKTPFNQNTGSSNTSVAIVNVDTNTMTPLAGGTSLETIAIPGNSRTNYDGFMIILPPGAMLGLNTAFAGAANAVIEVFYWEE